jgi:hypothetical protein
VSSGNAITIAANGVTLDLNGFTIASTAPSATGYGILINNSLRDLAILNGHIRGGVTNNGSGVYSGSGFWFGIFGYPQNVRVSGVSVSGCYFDGIYLGTGDSTVVEACTVRTVGRYGIVASIIKASVAMDCGGTAINGVQVADCRGECTGSDYGLSATTALNCYGFSGSGTGLYAFTAQNCYGSSSTGIGLNAINTAQNCFGISYGSGIGLDAFLVNNCYGQSSSSSYGIYAYDIATGSYGKSTTGIGLRAYIANSCDGNSFAITHPYNMP